MTDDELRQRMRRPEDCWTERKPENVHRALVRKTVVAFANSLPEGEQAVLFIGIADDGQFRGVTNPDQTQRNVREWLGECYPPILHTARVITVDDTHIVAVIVQPDPLNRPHFIGPGFVRIGSESIPAGGALYDELIASRTSKARDLIKAKNANEPINLSRFFYGFVHNMRSALGDWMVVSCTPTLVTFRTVAGNEEFATEYGHIRLTRTPDGKQLKVDVDF